MAHDPVMFGHRAPRTELEARREIAAERFPISCFIRSTVDGLYHQVVGHSDDGSTLATFLNPWGMPYTVPIDQAVRVPANLVIGTPKERAAAASPAVLWDEAAE